MSFEIKVISSVNEVPAEQWNILVDEDFPFFRHEFLLALENSEAVGEKYGWLTQHFLLYENNVLTAVLPAYIKFNSYGEFVFDWAWADAYQRYGLDYYPKLVTSVPYTPATGPRILTTNNENKNTQRGLLVNFALEFTRQNNLSSYHCLFTNTEDTEFFKNSTDLMMRLGCQFHWFNHDYSSFDDFLSTMSSNKRKKIRRERKSIVNQQITFDILNGNTASSDHWDIYHQFYEDTFDRKSGIPTLSKGFFKEIAKTMPENIVLIMAKKDEEYIASAFCLRGKNTLFGRHWGCNGYYENLHFETCYYQGLDYAIKNKLRVFEPGAQGEHKIARGFIPVKTWSAHYVADERFATSIQNFLTHETNGMLHYIEELNEHVPYKT